MKISSSGVLIRQEHIISNIQGLQDLIRSMQENSVHVTNANQLDNKNTVTTMDFVFKEQSSLREQLSELHLLIESVNRAPTALSVIISI